MKDIYSSKFSIKYKKSSYISNLFIRVLCCVVIYLVSAIYINSSDFNRSFFKSNILDKNFNYSYFTNIYNKYFGKVFPVENIDDEMVFNEELFYKDIDVYKDGYKLTVGEKYLIPFLKSGLIVFVGEKEDYGNTVIVQGIDGTDIWYCNVNLINHSIYDYVSEGTVLGEANSNNIYMLFYRDGKFIGHEDYFI